MSGEGVNGYVVGFNENVEHDLQNCYYTSLKEICT